MITSNEDWTRVVLYGTYDGFVRKDESLQIAIMLDGGERVEIPSECVMSADQIIKKDKIKLKDVINRIKYFDLVTQAVWINGILNELGSGYGLHKYHEGYKQGKLDGAMEREKVQVPQFVADWIEECKNDDFHLFGAMEEMSLHQKKLDYWFREDDNMELFARAWLDGYKVEKEPKYTVKIKAVNQYLVRNTDEDFLGFLQSRLKSKFTHKELEEAGLEEVFNSPLFEVEEVEE